MTTEKGTYSVVSAIYVIYGLFWCIDRTLHKNELQLYFFVKEP